MKLGSIYHFFLDSHTQMTQTAARSIAGILKFAFVRPAMHPRQRTIYRVCFIESVYAILNLCASLVHCKNRSPTTLTFSAKAFPRPKWADSQASKITQTVEKGYKFVYTLSDGWDIQLIIVCLACVINLANQGGSQSVGFNCKTHLLGGNSARCSTLRSGF